MSDRLLLDRAALAERIAEIDSSIQLWRSRRKRLNDLLSFLSDDEVCSALYEPLRAPGGNDADPKSPARSKSPPLRGLILRILKEEGGTSGMANLAIVSELRRAYGRAVDRTSVSAQLTRLERVGAVEHHGRRWRIHADLLTLDLVQP